MFVEFERMSAIRIIQFTDPHLFGDASATLRGVNTLETLERTLADASGPLAMCDAILVTGDLVQDDVTGYAHFRRIFGRFGKPVLCIPGNHDSVPELRAALQGRPFELDGPADIGAWRIVLLDSVVPNQAGGRISVEMLTKLDEELGMARQRHALVCLHHHPVAMNSRWLDNVGLANANEFWSVIDSHPQVRAVAWGHVHQAFEGARRNVRLLATPSTCAQFQPRSNDFVIDDQPPAYRLLTLHSNGAIDTGVHFLTAAESAA
jgi:Icc protein